MGWGSAPPWEGPPIQWMAKHPIGATPRLVGGAAPQTEGAPK